MKVYKKQPTGTCSYYVKYCNILTDDNSITCPYRTYSITSYTSQAVGVMAW